MPRQRRHVSRQDYGTPPEFVAAVERYLGTIVFDLAASESNAVARPYYTEAEDALAQDWSVFRGLLWCNPPYSKIAPWAAKCSETIRAARPLASGALLIALLTPASVGSAWFAQHVHRRALVLALRPRLTFVGHAHPYPKDCILSIYGLPAGFDVWRWQ